MEKIVTLKKKYKPKKSRNSLITNVQGLDRYELHSRLFLAAWAHYLGLDSQG